MNRAEPDPRRWKALVVISVAYLMVILDISIVNVALPAIQADLGFSVTNLQWVVSGYGLTFAGFLLLAGRCGDLLGRRRVFAGGLALFSLASLVCGLAESASVLIAARGIQGVAGAMLTASAFSLVGVTFDEGDERNKALGVMGAVSGGGAALGVVLGGVLTDYLGWAWIFLVNVPVGLVALGFARLVVSESRETGTTRHFDAQGAVIVTAGLVMMVYTITRAPTLGWGTSTSIGLLAGSVGLLASFVFVELRSRAPLVPLEVFRRRTFAAANLIGFGVGMSTISTFFLLSLYMQQVLGYTALEAGVAYLSVTCGTVVASAVAYRLIGLVGVKIALGAGITLLVGSLACFTAVSADGSYVADLLPGFILIGSALGLTFVPLSVVSLSGFSDRETGLASGLFNTSQQIGAALGVAVVATVAAAPRTEVTGQVGVVEGLTGGFAVALGTAVAALVATAVVLRRTDDVRPAERPRSPAGRNVDGRAGATPTDSAYRQVHLEMDRDGTTTDDRVCQRDDRARIR